MAQFSLCCILVLFCFYFAQYPIQIENIVSNAAHPHVERSNIKLVFLPPNTTSKLQPCDAGIIQTVKLCYRTKLLRRITFAIDEVESASSLAKNVTSRTETTASNWEQQLVKRAQEGNTLNSGEEELSTPIDEEAEAQEPSVITVHDAVRMIEELRRFCLENDKPEIVETMLRFEGTVQQIKFDKIKKAK